MRLISVKIPFLLSLLFFVFQLKATNDTLTIARAFNWQAGDSFVFRTFYSVTIPNGPNTTTYHTQYSGFISFSVLARQDFQDSIIYQVHFPSMGSAINEIIIRSPDSLVTAFTGFGNTPLNYGCDYIQNIPACDSPLVNWCTLDIYYDPLVGGRLTLKNNISLFETGHVASYTENMGLRHLSYSALEYTSYVPGLPGGCGIDLVYYRSDSAEWIDSAVYFGTNIVSKVSDLNRTKLYPNPCSTNMYLELSSLPPNKSYIQFYDALGREVQRAEIYSKITEITRNNLPTGIYFWQLQSENQILDRGKLLFE